MKGLIYKLVCDDEVYIGSTVDLKNRMRVHRRDAKRHPERRVYKHINENGGWDNVKVEIIDEVECESKDEMRLMEGDYIREYGTLNVKVEGRTSKEYMKEWCKGNKDQYLKHQKIYYQHNKNQIKDRMKQNYQHNIQSKKNYCDKCDIVCQSNSKLNHHFKTKKHRNNQK